MKQNVAKKLFITIFFGTTILSSTAEAGSPVWTYSAPSPASLVLAEDASATIQYTVTNQSHKPKTLILRTPGLSAPPCFLAGKGSTCSLELTVNGSQIPAQGLQTSPVLCDQSNLNQCYQPSPGQEFKVTLPTTNLRIISPTAIQTLDVNGSSTISIEVENSGSTNANNVQMSSSWTGIVYNPSTCGTIVPGGKCTFTIATNTPNVAGTISIQGDNTIAVTTPFIAFRAGGGLVFSKDGGVTKVVMDKSSSVVQSLRWDVNCIEPTDPVQGCLAITSGTDRDNGKQNTDNIIASLGTSGFNYAALNCRNANEGGFTDWYLPAICELGASEIRNCSVSSIYNNLYVHGFPVFESGVGEVLYWSSTQATNLGFALDLYFAPGRSVGVLDNEPKYSGPQTLCVRSFN